MKENLKSWIIGAVIVVILILPIIINGINSKKIAIKSFNDFYDNISKTDFALYYFGETTKEDYSEYKEMLRNIRNSYKVDVFTIDNKKLSDDEKSKLSTLNSEFNNENVYAFVVDNELRKVTSDKLTEKNIAKYVDLYYNHIIPDDEVAYKTVSTYKEYMKLANSKKITMTVFGRNSCSWCNKFKPVYNEVAAEYNLDIYYIDSDSFDSTEYSKILNSGLQIPAKCTQNGEEAPLSSGFGTPLSIFTQNGKSIDCIGGYLNKTNLVSTLKSIGLIEE